MRSFALYARVILILMGVVLLWTAHADRVLADEPKLPLVGEDVVFEEVDGVVAVEAEHFFKQTHDDVRRWYLTTAEHTPDLKPDIDPPHVEGASGGAYLEILPDTRWTHGEKLIWGENFMNDPGKMAILSYKVHINNPGRYYVWARIYSTGSEDNGMHVGIDGTWPESGRRMQWTAKRQWVWGSKQRTEQVHSGVPYKLYLDIDTPGEHIIQFSMREDGTEFDKWMMTTQKLEKVGGVGPEPRVKQGVLPAAFAAPAPAPKAQRQPDGDGSVQVTGELKQWHKVTLTLDGPFAHELDNDPNPFTDYRMDVRFEHESGSPSYLVPGYFAADGNAAQTSADAGTKWRAHLSPDKPGKWSYRVSFVRVNNHGEAQALAPFDGASGSFEIAPTDKTGRDFRAQGRLQYVGKHHLRFAGSGRYFLKAGADAPETLLAYQDFDGTVANKPGVPLKSWSAHIRDWNQGDPTWQNGKGKGMIGAINYLAGKGCNVMSFMPYNAGGDGDNVWPFVSRNDKFHYDCSKLDQWQIVFDHAQSKGVFLHFKTQETENDDNRGWEYEIINVPASLDNGQLGPERKLYYRELIARFGYLLGLNWNLGEETTQSTEEHKDMARFFHENDPYHHLIVIHTKGGMKGQAHVYEPLLGDQSHLTGASLQNWWSETHKLTWHWVKRSDEAGKPWVVANDEQGSHEVGVPPDPGYQGYQDGEDSHGNPYPTVDQIRKATLWGNLMAGGAGVEYYFGYKAPQTDLNCEDWRSRDRSWDYAAIALSFFNDNDIPFWDMTNRDELVGNPNRDNSRYCLAKPGQIYLVYLPDGGVTALDLSQESPDSKWQVSWFNPRQGGALIEGQSVTGGAPAEIGPPPADPDQDWLAVVRLQ